ncbi:MAG TPA: sigma-70 family RNA polymerase sigma factor [Chthoniobacteraceae bacterium]|jgi:RNA polymerase sigma-70 factor (ECF subfamily)|nr:sigma-70 family RNA polymerase sigma factor [Chthoniobacteraceae bacterium]
MSSDSPTEPNANSPAAHQLLVQRLFVKHQSVIKAYILSLLPSLADAEDALQETFLTVSAKAGSFEEGTNFVAWACTIGRFKVLEARRKLNDPRAITDEAIEALAEEVPEPLFFEEQIDAMRNCLERLAPRAKQIVWLRYHGGMSCEDVGRQVGWGAAAVRVALAKARNVLRTCVEFQMRRAV